LLPSMARVYADVNQHMPRAYWDYDSVNISWGVLENYEVVRKIGAHACPSASCKTTS
jgi:casein kinase II subunit alpha